MLPVLVLLDPAPELPVLPVLPELPELPVTEPPPLLLETVAEPELELPEVPPWAPTPVTMPVTIPEEPGQISLRPRLFSANNVAILLTFGQAPPYFSICQNTFLRRQAPL